MAGDLRLRHREAHVGEEPRARRSRIACSVSAYGCRGRRADDVDSELLPQPGELRARHLARKVSPSARYDRAVKAVRIHEDGGPEVLRYEDAPDPAPGSGEVLIGARGGLAQPSRHLAAPWSALGAQAADPRRGRRRGRRRARRRRRPLRRGRPGRHQPRPRRRGQDRGRAHGRHPCRADRAPS